MNLPKILLSLSLLILFTACKKKKEGVIEAEQIVSKKIDTVQTFYPLDQGLKPYYNFSDDSYWVFYDTVTKSIDSLYLKDFNFTTDTIKKLSGTTLSIDIYESCHYMLKGKGESLTFTVRSHTVGIYTNYIFPMYALPFPILYSLDCQTCDTESYDYTIWHNKTNKSTRNCNVFKDTVHLKFGQSFIDARFFIHQDPGGYASVTRIPSPAVYSKSLWVANIGLVQFETPYFHTINYQLLRYHVTQR